MLFKNKYLHIYTTPRPRGVVPLGALLALPLMMMPAGGWLVESDALPLNRCTFKTMFGIPCMGCGATRATLNLLHGDWWEAIYFNPMIIIFYSCMILWGVVSLWSFVRGKEVHMAMVSWLAWAGRASLIAIPLANWLYLYKMGI